MKKIEWTNGGKGGTLRCEVNILHIDPFVFPTPLQSPTEPHYTFVPIRDAHISSSVDNIVRNTKGFVSYFIMRKYTSVPYIGGISVRYK